MIIPMPKPIPAGDDADSVVSAPDALNMDLRRQAWALSEQERYADAADVWRSILDRRHDDADAADELGVVLGKLDKHDDAMAAFRRGLQFDPTNRNIRHRLAAVLLKLGQHAEARTLYEDLTARKTGDIPALLGLSEALRGLKRHEDALRVAQQACESAPDDADALFGKAQSLRGLGRVDEAIAAYREALNRKPAHRDAGMALSDVLCGERRWNEAVVVLEALLQQHPDLTDGWNALGLANLELRDYPRAVSMLQKVLSSRPASAAVHCNLALALSGMARIDAAQAACRTALVIEPGSRTARFILASLLLSQANFDEGWDAYEFRFAEQPVKTVRDDLRAAPWRGESLRGKSILVIGEQANGDYLQFIRYLQPLCDMGAEVHLFGPHTLKRILSSISAQFTYHDTVPNRRRFDFQCYLMSLPGRFHRLGLPIPATPYLRAEPERVEKWRRRIGSDGFRVGIVWYGAEYGKVKSVRAFPLQELLPVARVPGVRLISLQKGAGVEQLDTMPSGMAVETLGSDFDATEDRFLDTAAVMEVLDLVITCDTAVSHLAGALGRPVWIALNNAPEWRWQRSGSASYWYPSARLFRQPGSWDWSSVLQEMAGELAAMRDGQACTAPAAAADVSPTVAAPSPKVAVSWGECIDKMTILEIKARKAASGQAAANIARELRELNIAAADILSRAPELGRYRAELQKINELLWDVEDELRLCETQRSFDDRFVALARSVYRHNDERARVKREINLLTRSAIVEEKLYAG